MSSAATITDQRGDRDRLQAAMLELRAIGYWAREAQPDGFKAVPEDVIKRSGKWVVSDERETSAYDESGMLQRALHLHHLSRDAEEIARLMRQNGLDAVIVQSPRNDQSVLIYPRLARQR